VIRNRDKSDAEAGLTVFELTIAMLVIAIIALIAVPSLMETTENYRLTAAAGQLVSDLHKARVWAITKDADIRVIRVDDSTYAIEEDVAGTWTNLENGTALPTGFTLTSSDPAGFGPYGNGDGGTYTLTNPNSRTRQVVVEVSGRIYAQ
jgi:Tfp pilus assembly protein FimT